jgi:hypothetical protein
MAFRRGSRRAFIPSLIAVMVVSALSGPSAVGATIGRPAAAGGETTFELTGGSAAFKVGGRLWHISPFDYGAVVGVSLSTTNESDQWEQRQPPASDLVVNPTTGQAVFDTHSSLKPLASFDLSFAPQSQKALSCQTGSATDVTGTLTGSLSLTANSKGLAFRSAHVSMRSATVEIDHDCRRPRSPTASTKASSTRRTRPSTPPPTSARPATSSRPARWWPER